MVLNQWPCIQITIVSLKVVFKKQYKTTVLLEVSARLYQISARHFMTRINLASVSATHGGKKYEERKREREKGREQNGRTFTAFDLSMTQAGAPSHNSGTTGSMGEIESGGGGGERWRNMAGEGRKM